MKRSIHEATALCLLMAAALQGCDVADTVEIEGSAEILAAHVEAPAPTPLVTVAGPTSSVEIWPFTTSLIGAPGSDPMNLVFPDVDVRSLRAALMMLGGDRSAFGLPNVPPFDCTWKESMGSNQTSFAAGEWTASAIQLECGDYGPIRFHVRLFPAGAWTIASTHFEVLIDGTNQHEVLSWELAEQLVTLDFVRSGLLAAPPSVTDVITPTPSFRTINPLVYNALPVELRLLIGGPPGPVVAPVPVANDGRAVLLALAGPVGGERLVSKREFTLQFDQTIPKPFCSTGPLDYLYVQGPIRFSQQVVVSGSGNYVTRFHAVGGLDLTPINPLTGERGDPLRARVAEHDRSLVTDHVTLVSTFQMQLILPGRDRASGRLFARLRVGPGSSDASSLEITCAA